MICGPTFGRGGMLISRVFFSSRKLFPCIEFELELFSGCKIYRSATNELMFEKFDRQH